MYFDKNFDCKGQELYEDYFTLSIRTFIDLVNYMVYLSTFVSNSRHPKTYKFRH